MMDGSQQQSQDGELESDKSAPESCHPPYEEVSLTDSLRYTTYRHVAHVMYYSRSMPAHQQRYRQPANIFMVLEEQGSFSFPGGMMELFDRSIVDGLNRELTQEINLKKNLRINLCDYIFTHVDHIHTEVEHFYVKQVTDVDLVQLAQRTSNAIDFGVKVYGHVIVPLYVLEDGFQGFPAFLCNSFKSNAKHVLIQAIKRLQLLNPQQLDELVAKSEQYIKGKL